MAILHKVTVSTALVELQGIAENRFNMASLQAWLTHYQASHGMEQVLAWSRHGNEATHVQNNQLVYLHEQAHKRQNNNKKWDGMIMNLLKCIN